MRAGRPVRVVPLRALGEADMVVDCGGMGAPTVGYEKLDANKVRWGCGAMHDYYYECVCLCAPPPGVLSGSCISSSPPPPCLQL